MLSREEIESRNFDLKVMNPNAVVEEDPYMPEELLDQIEQEGCGVAETSAQLRRIIGDW